MLSIIIPALNEEKYIGETLKSIHSQNYKNYEIIVADAGSKDKTKQIAKKYKAKVIKGGLPGPGRNNGAKVAKGDIFLFLDADTPINKNFISKSLEEFKKRNLDVAGYYIKFDSKKLIYKLFSLIYNISCFLAQFTKPIAIGSAIMVKKEFHNKVKGFDETIFIGEDHDYSHRISKIGKFRVIKSKKLVYSIRRFEKEGKIKTYLKWMYGSIYVFFRGPIRKKIVKYEFGKH